MCFGQHIQEIKKCAEMLSYLPNEVNIAALLVDPDAAAKKKAIKAAEPMNNFKNIRID